jgi:hypothetical protein
MLGDHKPHQVETLAKVADSARKALDHDQQRLDVTLQKFAEKVRQGRDKKEILSEAVRSVRAEIQTNYAQLVSLAEKHRDEELAKLDR